MASRGFACREMLEESVSDLRSTMCELQERLRSVDGEGEYTSVVESTNKRFHCAGWK